MPETKILTRLPQVTFGTEGVMPPIDSYVDRNDRIRIVVHNSVSGLSLNIHGRFLTPKGVMQAINELFTPGSTRVGEAAIFNLGEGFLLDLAIIESAGGHDVRRGQCFVEIRRHRGGAVGIMTGVLLADYLTKSGPVGFPRGQVISSVDGPGAIRSIAGTNPAAGVEIAESVPTGARWRLLGLSFTLVTDGTAANRRVNIGLDDGTTLFYEIPSQSDVAASTTEVFGIGADALARSSISDLQTMGLPAHALLFQGFRIVTRTVNLQAGDNFGAPQLWVEEWIET